MKYLITTKDGLSEKTDLIETPQLNTLVQFKDCFYKVIDIIYFIDYIQLKTFKKDLNPKPIQVTWS